MPPRCKIYKWAQIKNATENQIRATLEEIGNGTEFGEDFQESCTVWEYDRISGVKNSLVTEVSSYFLKYPALRIIESPHNGGAKVIIIL